MRRDPRLLLHGIHYAIGQLRVEKQTICLPSHCRAYCLLRSRFEVLLFADIMHDTQVPASLSGHQPASTSDEHVARMTTNDDDSVAKHAISIVKIEDVVEKDKELAPSLRREFLHGKRLAFAFAGWLMTEFMGGMVGLPPPL